jgi:hypothetical protein
MNLLSSHHDICLKKKRTNFVFFSLVRIFFLFLFIVDIRKQTTRTLQKQTHDLFMILQRRFFR